MPAIQIQRLLTHYLAIQTLLLQFIYLTTMQTEVPCYKFQWHILLKTPDLLSTTDVAYGSIPVHQKNYQTWELAIKIPHLCSLNTIVTSSIDTPGMALTNWTDLVLFHFQHWTPTISHAHSLTLIPLFCPNTSIHATLFFYLFWCTYPPWYDYTNYFDAPPSLLCIHQP